MRAHMRDRNWWCGAIMPYIYDLAANRIAFRAEAAQPTCQPFHPGLRLIGYDWNLNRRDAANAALRKQRE
jgi:hypothetical protein